MARDRFHFEFKEALQKEGWIVTNDPLVIKIGRIQVQIDLGAERLMAAEKDGEKIAIEIKTFSNVSFITALYEAVGKYVIYRNFLKSFQPERTLFLAMPKVTYAEFFEEPALKQVMLEEKFKFIIYDSDAQIITQWIK